VTAAPSNNGMKLTKAALSSNLAALAAYAQC
jgi:hypothetical protein